MFAIVATFAVCTLALAPFASRLADAIRPAPSLAPARVRGPHLTAFDLVGADVWGWV